MRTLLLFILCWGIQAQILQKSVVNSATPTTDGTPTFSPAAGTYTSTQTVTISTTTTTPGTVICYNTTGSPSATIPGTCDGGSTLYTAPVSVSVTSTLYAIASTPLEINSAIGSAAYTISAATPALIQGPFSTPNDVQTQSPLTISNTNNYMLLPLGTLTQSSDTIVVMIVSASATSNLSLTDDGSSSNTYTLQASETAGSRTIAFYTAPVTHTSRNVKMTCASATNCADNQMVAWEYANLGAADKTCNATVTTGTSLACSSMTTTANGDFIIVAADVVTYSATPSGFAGKFTAQTGSTPTWTLAHAHDLDWSASQTAIQATAGAITPAITVSAAVTRANIAGIAFLATAAGGAQPPPPYLIGMQNQNSGNSGWGFSSTSSSTAQVLQVPCVGNSLYLLIGQIDSATITHVGGSGNNIDSNGNTWAGLTLVDSTGDGFAIQWWHTTTYPATCNGTEAVTVTFSANPSTLIPLWVFFDVNAASGYDGSATCGAGSMPCAINTTCSSTSSCGGATITPSGYPALVLSYQNQDFDSISASNIGRFITGVEVCPALAGGCGGAGTGTSYAYVGPGVEQDAGILADNLASGSAAITWTVQNTQSKNPAASFSSTIAIK